MGFFPWFEPDQSNGRVIPWSTAFPTDTYTIGKLIGQGSFGSVYECYNCKSRQWVACKVIPKTLITNAAIRDVLRWEMQIMRKVSSHRNIVSLEAVHEDPSAVYFVMERCFGGDLFDYTSRLGKIPEPEAANIFGQLVSAVSFCHKIGVVHRDLKPENVLLTCGQSDTSSAFDPSSSPLSRESISTCSHQGSPQSSIPCSSSSSSLVPFAYDGSGGESKRVAAMTPDVSAASLREAMYPRVKLTDFGMAAQSRPGGWVTGRVGSLPYEAPEVMTKTRYTFKADIWSLGIILYTMLSGKWPFYAKKKKDLIEQIRAGRVDLSSGPWLTVSREAKDLIQRMLSRHPSQRPTCSEILQHPWLVRHFVRAEGSVPMPIASAAATAEVDDVIVNYECSGCKQKQVDLEEGLQQIYWDHWNKPFLPDNLHVYEKLQGACDVHLHALGNWWGLFVHRDIADESASQCPK
eukprot:TRINITY_DN8716_c0_g1_i1.p1 TRINITY_DN8716_c0_g1~~TRINITY_DN8716_c0_g1_i1.p1  ORF type:complete len:462 (-),score=11.02 TRINITY_DN8716_c0_g1_i1:80-1465(-)